MFNNFLTSTEFIIYGFRVTVHEFWDKKKKKNEEKWKMWKNSEAKKKKKMMKGKVM